MFQPFLLSNYWAVYYLSAIRRLGALLSHVCRWVQVCIAVWRAPEKTKIYFCWNSLLNETVEATLFPYPTTPHSPPPPPSPRHQPSTIDKTTCLRGTIDHRFVGNNLCSLKHSSLGDRFFLWRAKTITAMRQTRARVWTESVRSCCL